MVGFGVIMPVLPFFLRELGASSLEMGLMTALWSAGQFMFAPLWGGLSDRIGRKPVLLIGLAGYCVTFGLMGAATAVWQLLAARLLGGILSAATIPAVQAYVADVTDGHERARAMASTGAAMNLGFLSGPAIGAALAFLGARGLFLTAAGLALVNTAATWIILPEPPRHAPTPARRRLTGVLAVGLALRGPHLVLYGLAFCTTFGVSTMFNLLGFYLADRFGAGAGMTGAVMTADGIAAFLLQALAVGWLAQRWGEERSVRAALLTGAAGFAGLILAPNLAGVFVAIIVVGAATAVIRPLVTSLVSRHTTLEQGITMGIQNSFDALGRTLGPLLAGIAYLWAWWAPFAAVVALFLVFSAWAGLALGGRPAAQNKPISHLPAN